MRKLIIFLLLAVYSLGLISAVETNPYQCSFDSICSPAECFSISRQLGEGAFGEVYAVKNSLGETFALKTYKVSEQEYTDNWLGALADAEREFQRGQMLDHAHIVKAYDLFSAKSCIQATNYLVLQLVEGKTLYDTRDNELTKKEGLEAAAQLCDALRYALAFDLMHLDLHQGNVMISKNGIMVIDLASFFTPEEIESEASSEFYSYNSLASKRLMAFAGPIQPEQKIKKILREQPKLLAQFKQPKPMPKQPAPKRSEEEEKKMRLQAFYFVNVCDMCIDIVEKIKMKDVERERLMTKIDKLADTCESAIEAGKAVSADDYFAKLETLLLSF